MHYQRMALHGTTDQVPMLTPEQRFLAKVTKGPDCWLWNGAMTPARYGLFYWSGRTGMATHFALQHFAGNAVPPGLHALHACDNPPCVNPSHLWIGSKKDNSADMYAKGRDVHNAPRGSAHPRAKLIEASVLEIRRLAARGTKQRALADRFGVNHRSIHLIVTRQSWKHI